VNLGYNFFVTRIDKLIIDMEQGTQQILNLAWDMEKAGTLVVTGHRRPAGPEFPGHGPTPRPRPSRRAR
jgi:hypothetical protein